MKEALALLDRMAGSPVVQAILSAGSVLGFLAQHGWQRWGFVVVAVVCGMNAILLTVQRWRKHPESAAGWGQDGVGPLGGRGGAPGQDGAPGGPGSGGGGGGVSGGSGGRGGDGYGASGGATSLRWTQKP